MEKLNAYFTTRRREKGGTELIEDDLPQFTKEELTELIDNLGLPPDEDPTKAITRTLRHYKKLENSLPEDASLYGLDESFDTTESISNSLKNNNVGSLNDNGVKSNEKDKNEHTEPVKRRDYHAHHKPRDRTGGIPLAADYIHHKPTEKRPSLPVEDKSSQKEEIDFSTTRIKEDADFSTTRIKDDAGTVRVHDDETTMRVVKEDLSASDEKKIKSIRNKKS